MKDNGARQENIERAASNGSGQADAGADEVCAVKRKSAPRKRLISSITQKTTINYILFSIIILALLWIAFFVGINWFYNAMVKREISEIGQRVSAAFPKRADNSFDVYFKYRLSEMARDNSSAIAIFIDNDGEKEMLMFFDAMGNSSDENGHLFDAILTELYSDAEHYLTGGTKTVGTEYGNFACYGDIKSVEQTVGGRTEMNLLVFKSYDIFNSQTLKIIYVLIICTAVVLLIACFYAYFASRHQTKHLKDFSQKAKRIAGGEYDVEFSGDGYDEYENLASALNSATESLFKAEAMQRDIVANVSHDIRTPLTMLRAYAEMIRDMPLDDEKRKKTANVIIDETERLTSLVDDILNYSRLQSGVAEFKFEDNDLSDIASSVLARFEIFRERDGIKFLSDIDKKATVYCDASRIEQVLYNLIINAINYCGDDKTVIVRIKNMDSRVRAEITDHGSGIAESDLESVWDRYYRAAHSKRKAVGSGLGLSICKNILTEHNADYGVTSAIGQGSTFWFELDKKQ